MEFIEGETVDAYVKRKGLLDADSESLAQLKPDLVRAAEDGILRKQRKFEQARQSYEEAAAAGYALSFFNLGVLYMNGEGVSRSPKKAEDQFRRSAVAGGWWLVAAAAYRLNRNSEVWILVLVLALVVVLDQPAFSPAKRARLSGNYFVQLV